MIFATFFCPLCMTRENNYSTFGTEVTGGRTYSYRSIGMAQFSISRENTDEGK